MSVTKEEKYKKIINSTRFYKKIIPDINEVVLVYIKGYQDMGIDCFINEYKTNAFMSFADASSSKKLRNIRKQVIKNRSYILITTKINSDKGFIDVEKRSIDKDQELEYTNLINFYQKVFTFFVKAYVFNNIDCSQEDVYTFLDNTLWKQDSKKIKENMYKIHTDPELVKEQYNLYGDLGESIFKNLIETIPEPKCSVVLKLQINSLALDAVGDIKIATDELSEITGKPFKVTSTPLYTCEFKSDYKDLESLTELFHLDHGEVAKYINNISMDKLYIKTVESNVKLIEV